MADNSVAKKAGLGEYLKGVRSEFKKVVWPTKKETYKYTGVVLVVCAFFALFFWLLDTGFLALLGLIVK
jgi:preprotein translocase subunit SecE